MAKINVRSPYYVSISLSNLTFVDMELWIYTGTKTTNRTTGTLFNLRSTAISNTSTFELSELVKDYVANTFSGDYENENVWVDYRTISVIGGVSQTPTSYTTLRAFYGYGYFEDGSNPLLNSDYLQSNTTVLKWEGEPLRIPIDTETTNTVSFYENGQEVYSEQITASNESNEQIKYINSDGSDFSTYEIRVLADGGTFKNSICLSNFEDEFGSFDVDTIYIDGANGVTVVKIQDIKECKYEPYKLTFENRFGVLQDLWFFKRTNLSLSTKKETFKRNIIENGTYNTTKHQTKILTKNGSEKLILNTGFYPELYNDVFKEFQLSENVWIEYENKTLPINIDSSSLEYKTSLNDKLISYTVNVSFAFDTINNIR